MRRSPTLATCRRGSRWCRGCSPPRCRRTSSCLHVSPPHDGTWSLGTEVNVLPAAVEACRPAAGWSSRRSTAMPWTYGDGVLPRTRSTCVLEADDPLSAPGPPVPDDAARRIGEPWRTGRGTARRCRPASAGSRTRPCPVSRCAAGCGCGARCSPTACSPSTGPVPWTPARDAHRSFLSARPSSTHGSTATRGSGAAHRDDERPDGGSPPTGAMTSINTALQVDLFGQANASRIGARIHSGFGGQTDFIVGALHSRRRPGADGAALLAPARPTRRASSRWSTSR